MKKLLFQLDPDPVPSIFDTVVGYDGGADHVKIYGGINPDNVGTLVDGAIFTRSPKEKKFTAIFVGGSNMEAGQNLLNAVRKKFFADFRVSVMLDSNGSNTTAAAGVALLAKAVPLKGKRVVVLAGTGPVGQRAAALLAEEGAQVILTSRQMERAQHACELMEKRFKVKLTPLEAVDDEARGAALKGAQIVFGAGAAGVQLLDERHWKDNATIEAMADTNATPPLGLNGVDMMDKHTERHGKKVIGAIGLGALKLKMHRACIAQLFERNDQVLDAEEIYAVAKAMA
ncbi:MAG TPA: NADP-dependent methylenetetrahydromethanopterin/methylenetetrahydrofolate dehydrogenase [Burkholderiales bacterium]|nr:NADP-dependent methylenetetrahydromethanopterin/methylenetetrahydrofolate dehydrogenase [Burkholderiales bacterium]